MEGQNQYFFRYTYKNTDFGLERAKKSKRGETTGAGAP